MRNHFPLNGAFKGQFCSKGVPALIAVVLLSASSAMAQIGTIDTFSTTLSPAYTKTTVLDNDTTRNVTFATSNGILQSTATATTAPEQTLLLRSDFSLSVGQVLRIDVPSFLGGSQDFGVAVSATATPTITTLTNGPQRADYIFAGFRSTQDHFVASGFNGTATLATFQVQAGTALIITGLFISRTSLTTFDVGYNDRNGLDTISGTYTVANTAIGNAVGFYSDMRGAGTIGNFDNLRITAVPEPSTWAMLIGGAGFLGLALRVRRTACRS